MHALLKSLLGLHDDPQGCDEGARILSDWRLVVGLRGPERQLGGPSLPPDRAQLLCGLLNRHIERANPGLCWLLLRAYLGNPKLYSRIRHLREVESLSHKSHPLQQRADRRHAEYNTRTSGVLEIRL